VLNDDSSGLHGDMGSLVAGGARSGGSGDNLSLGESLHEKGTLSSEVGTGSVLSSTSSSPEHSHAVVMGLSGADVFSFVEVHSSLEVGHSSGVMGSNLGSSLVVVSVLSLQVSVHGSPVSLHSLVELRVVSADMVHSSGVNSSVVGHTSGHHFLGVSMVSTEVGHTSGMHFLGMSGTSSGEVGTSGSHFTGMSGTSSGEVGTSGSHFTGMSTSSGEVDSSTVGGHSSSVGKDSLFVSTSSGKSGTVTSESEGLESTDSLKVVQSSGMGASSSS